MNDDLTSRQQDRVVRENIVPDDVIDWLVSYRSINNESYTRNIARMYMYIVCAAPLRLQLPFSTSRINAFTCRNTGELLELWDTYKQAPNYSEVNRDFSDMFSAGMNCLLQYTEHLENKDEDNSGLAILNNIYDTNPSQDIELLARDDTDDESVTQEQFIQNILSMHFSNGYRLNSPIELKRFRSFAEQHGVSLALQDEALIASISACSTISGEKAYAVSEKTKNRIRSLAETYFMEGARVIFYSEFYAKHFAWLFDEHVVSEDVLIVLLREMFPELSYAQVYFGYMESSIAAILESEILRVWQSECLLSYDQLSARLEYIPLERIKYALNYVGDFIRNDHETVTHLSKIDMTEQEKSDIRETATKECNAHGYVSISTLPLGEMAERNYELSIDALQNAVYQLCLKDGFDKKRSIITRKGDTFDAQRIMKEHFRTVDKCTLSDLVDFERELTGKDYRNTAMSVGNAVMICVDKDTYVSESHVDFDVYKIDKAIEQMMEGDYIPIKSFTAFGAFPDCGQTWNLFLLESYLRRFSEKFRFDAPAANTRNAGAVIRKSCEMNYIEIMADAVAHADVQLETSAVNKFLYESGYMGKSSTVRAIDIIAKASVLRERLD